MISRSDGASDFGHLVNRRAHKAHRDIRGAPLSMFSVLKSRGLESTVSPRRLDTSGYSLSLLKKLPALLHRGWVVLFRPWLGSNCRFHPVCSDYAREAVERLGWIRGGALAIGRICRCHPYCKGGFDPVPNR